MTELRQLLPLKPTDFLVLAVLQDGPLHGYALSQEMERRSAGYVRVRPGDLYRVLYRLAEQDLIVGEQPAGSAERRRTAYRLSDLGQRVVVAEARRLSQLSNDVLTAGKPAQEAS